jgi:hypothetical protein
MTSDAGVLFLVMRLGSARPGDGQSLRLGGVPVKPGRDAFGGGGTPASRARRSRLPAMVSELVVCVQQGDPGGERYLRRHKLHHTSRRHFQPPHSGFHALDKAENNFIPISITKSRMTIYVHSSA